MEAGGGAGGPGEGKAPQILAPPLLLAHPDFWPTRYNSPLPQIFRPSDIPVRSSIQEVTRHKKYDFDLDQTVRSQLERVGDGTFLYIEELEEYRQNFTLYSKNRDHKSK